MLSNQKHRSKVITNNTMSAIMALMNDDTRELTHHKMAPCTNHEFLKEYCKQEPSFADVLKNEFGIEL